MSIKNKINLNIAILFVFTVGILVLCLAALKPAWAVLGNYNRTDTSLSIADWNFLDEDFALKEGDTMTGGVNMNNIGITAVSTDSGDLTAVASAGYVNTRVGSSVGGTTYVNWGRGDCSGDVVVYSGFGFGVNYNNTSGGDNDICLQMPAEAGFLHAGPLADKLQPSMIGTGGYYPISAYSPAKSFIKCAVCYRSNSSCYTVFGSHTCAGAFSDKAYDGYSVGALNELHALSRERRCLNQNFDNSGGISSTYGAPWYGSFVAYNFGLSGYNTFSFIKCAVCCN